MRRDVLLALELATLRSTLEAMLAPLDQFSIDGAHDPGWAGKDNSRQAEASIPANTRKSRHKFPLLVYGNSIGVPAQIRALRPSMSGLCGPKTADSPLNSRQNGKGAPEGGLQVRGSSRHYKLLI